MFVRIYRYTIAEHDGERPWIVIGEIQHLTVELEDSRSFYEWAAREWPGPRFDVQLDSVERRSNDSAPSLPG
jgi:hypothetical protein